MFNACTSARSVETSLCGETYRRWEKRRRETEGVGLIDEKRLVNGRMWAKEVNEHFKTPVIRNVLSMFIS